MTPTTIRRSLVVAAASALALLAVPMLTSPASADPRATGGVTITQEQNTNGCNGVRTTPGSENTTKTLIGGTLVPGGTAIFQISFPFDPTKLTGQDTFTMTDCVFIGDTAIAKYDLSGVPNGTSPFVFTITLDIPADADLGAEYCNYVRTESNPTAPNESNRKAGPACFRIGGDIRVVKVAAGDDSMTPLPGATFTVSCVTPTGEETVPPVVISGLSGSTSFTGGAYVASGVSATGEIAIAGPIGTVCTVTETKAPSGYDLPADPTQELTIGAEQVTGTFVDPLHQNNTTITTTATVSTSVGGSLSDVAHLAGATSDAGGTITFRLYDTADCSNDPVFTSTADVSGSGDYTSGVFTPTTPGSYYWIASYSGDSTNQASAGSCGDTGETSVVNAKSSSSTTTPPPSSTSVPSMSNAAQTTGPIAATGAGPVNTEVAWALAVLLLGSGLTFAGWRRYQRRH